MYVYPNNLKQVTNSLLNTCKSCSVSINFVKNGPSDELDHKTISCVMMICIILTIVLIDHEKVENHNEAAHRSRMLKLGYVTFQYRKLKNTWHTSQNPIYQQLIYISVTETANKSSLKISLIPLHKINVHCISVRPQLGYSFTTSVSRHFTGFKQFNRISLTAFD